MVEYGYMIKQPLTKKQRQTLEFLIKFYNTKLYFPTHQELSKHFDIKLGGSTFDRLRRLEEKGYIKRKKGRARFISIIR